MSSYVKCISKREKAGRWSALAFVATFFVMWIAFSYFEVYPFGNKQTLVQDAWHQYYPFLVDLRSKLLNGESLFYTWNNGLGTNFLAMSAYYSASPMNLLLPLFPEEHLQLFFTLAVTLKLGLASAFTAYALQKVFGRYDISATVFGCCFGMCAFFMGYYWNIMWLDSVALLPMVSLGVVSLVREGKFRLYVVSLALCLICNFLIGLYVCIFTFFFFFVVGFCCDIDRETFGKRFVQIAVFTLIAIAITACVMLPVFMAMQNTNDFSMAAPTWKLKESFVKVFGNFAAFGGPTDREGLPNLYCGLPCVLLGALYAVSDRIPKRQRLCALGLLVMLILSLNVSVIEYMWNGFHTTNMLPYRFSFLVSFVLVAMAFCVLPELLEGLPRWKYLLMTGGAAALLVLCWFTHDAKVTKTNAVVLACYLIAAFLLRNHRRALAVVLSVILLGEMIANAIIGVETVRVTTGDNFPAQREEVQSLMAQIAENDTSFYRMESVPRQTLNDPSLLGYRGVSTFSSLANVNVSRAMENFGIASYPVGNRYYNNQIGTPVANAFLGLKYFVTKGRAAEDALYLRGIAATESCVAYENTAVLPLGFMVADGMEEEPLGENPYAVQNSLFSAATGSDAEVFEVIDLIHVGHKNLKVFREDLGNYTYTLEDKTQDGVMKYNYEMPRDGQLYVYIDCKGIDKKKMEILCNGNVIQKYGMSAQPDVLCAGYYTQGDIVSFRWNMGKDIADDSKMKIYVALLNEAVFEEGFAHLADEPLQITDFTANSLSGTIEVKEDGYFYTSIPYENGWTLYVDGEEREITPWQNAFVALENLEAGVHTVEMKFVPAGFALGTGISLCGLALFAVAIAMEKRLKKDDKSGIGKKR